MAEDAVTIAPHIYEVVVENERVLEVQGNPGDKAKWHSHPAQVAIGYADSQFTFISRDEQTIEAELKAGNVYGSGGAHHGDYGEHRSPCFSY